ncbi:MAG: AsmA family protein, partial [Proteobacteria bacterium]|nr:AsmA family protein [Pseudomonadota bacterium]
MRIRTALKIGVVLVVAITVGIVAVIFNLDPNDHKDRIAAYVARETGRTLTIEGPIDLEWGRTTRIAVRDVSLSNPAWAQAPQMAHIDEADIRFALLPLLRGRIDIDHLTLRGARVFVETDKEGRSNLDFKEAQAKPDRDDRERNFGIDLEIAELEIDDVRVSYRDGQAGTETIGTVQRIKALPAEPGAPLDIDIAADVRLGAHLAKIDLDGQIGSWNDIIRGDRQVPFDLTGEVLGLNVEIDGAVRGPENPTGFDIDVLISGDVLATVQPFLATPLPKLGDVSLSAEISGGQESPVVNVVFLNAANTHVTGKLNLALSDGAPDVAIDLKAELRDQGLAAVEPLARISLAHLGPVNGTVNIVGDLETLRFEPNRVSVAESFVSGSVTVGPLLDNPDVSYDLIVTANGQTLGVAEPIAGVSLPDVGPIKGEIRVIGNLDKARVESSGLSAEGTVGRGRVDVANFEADDPDVTLNLVLTATDQSLDSFRGMLGDALANLGPVGGEGAGTGTLPDMRLMLTGFTVDNIEADGDVTLDVDADEPIIGFRLDIAAEEQTLEQFQALLGFEWPDLGPVEFAGLVAGNLERMTLERFSFRSATTDLAGHARLVLDPAAIEVEAVVTSETTDLTRLFPDFEPAHT